MPTYIYKCPKCGTEVEWAHSVKDVGKKVHNACCGVYSEIVIHATPVIFKGGGWTPRT